MGFVKGKCSGKSKKRFHAKSAIVVFIKNVLNSKEKILRRFDTIVVRIVLRTFS